MCSITQEEFIELGSTRRKSIVRVTAPDELTMTADGKNFRNRVYPSNDIKVSSEIIPISSNMHK